MLLFFGLRHLSCLLLCRDIGLFYFGGPYVTDVNPVVGYRRNDW